VQPGGRAQAFLPVMFVAMVAVRLHSPGPAVPWHDREGMTPSEWKRGIGARPARWERPLYGPRTHFVSRASGRDFQ